MMNGKFKGNFASAKSASAKKKVENFCRRISSKKLHFSRGKERQLLA
jgi:hypothetical protein